EVATLASGFTVTSPCAVKQTATGGVTPYFGVVGMQNMVVHIKSSNLVQGLTTADFGPDITVNSITVTDQNSADVNISISPSAQASSRSVTLTTANVVANVKGLDGADFYVMH
ncbi:MAG TPA: hypothetical protein VLK33_16570, partial [Terriglobales bacterium]|nr:hypothetical protein [Terriglobales bacterium]